MRVEFVDFEDQSQRAKHPEMAETVQSNRWSLPLVTLDGKLEFSGYIDHRAIVQSIERKKGNIK